jgi:hypothetical protein
MIPKQRRSEIAGEFEKLFAARGGEVKYFRSLTDEEKDFTVAFLTQTVRIQQGNVARALDVAEKAVDALREAHGLDPVPPKKPKLRIVN